jgi:hypothetical protein
MVHLTVNSLNSLAEILREAKPLYAECQFIISDLAKDGEESPVPICAGEQPLLQATSRGSHSGNGNRSDARRVEHRPQHDSNGLNSGNRGSKAKGSMTDVLGQLVLTKADPVTESRTMVKKLVSPLLTDRYDREELYAKVWTLTMRTVAKEYGVSDVAIGKTCRKLYIPVPGRGYWAKKAANQPVAPRPPLPKVQVR